MKITFIATVLNEEKSIDVFIKSILSQSRKADEIIIVDGGSSDGTVSIIRKYRGKIKTIVKKGNRAVGRNEAVKKANNEIIVCSDAGCVFDKDWIKKITKPFEKISTDVVAGYYKGYAKNIFQKCLIPYVLVMPDKVDKNIFLPATRSMAFKKSVWKTAGGFPEEFSNNEDYVFANNLKKINAKIVFEKKAIVYWKPRSNIKDAFTMFYRFAKGDSESRIFRPKVILIFIRYIIVLVLLSLLFILKLSLILNTLYLILLAYILWSVIKNYKYVKDSRGIFLFPLIQFTSDIAVICGTIEGLISFYKLPLSERHQQ